MGIKINKTKCLLALTLLFSIKMSAQNKLLEVKKYAFNKCISYNYQQIDSTFYSMYKDASGIEISINGNFLEDDKLKNKIMDYTINNAGLYYSKKNDLHFETGNKNIIFCNCFDFYESKALDVFVKSILRNKK